MKAIFIVFNQALNEKVHEILENEGVRGFTKWEEVKGRGSVDGEPHLGSHTWPAMNSSILSFVEPEDMQRVLGALNALNHESPLQGLRAFVWDAQAGI